jgi:hypothetical protein
MPNLYLLERQAIAKMPTVIAPEASKDVPAGSALRTLHSFARWTARRVARVRGVPAGQRPAIA